MCKCWCKEEMISADSNKTAKYFSANCKAIIGFQFSNSHQDRPFNNLIMCSRAYPRTQRSFPELLIVLNATASSTMKFAITCRTDSHLWVFFFSWISDHLYNVLKCLLLLICQKQKSLNDFLDQDTWSQIAQICGPTDKATTRQIYKHLCLWR